MTFVSAWGSIPADFHEPVTNVLPLYYKDSATGALKCVNSDRDYGVKQCINAVVDMLKQENVKPVGAIMGLIQGLK